MPDPQLTTLPDNVIPLAPRRPTPDFSVDVFMEAEGRVLFEVEATSAYLPAILLLLSHGYVVESLPCGGLSLVKLPTR